MLHTLARSPISERVHLYDTEQRLLSDLKCEWGTVWLEQVCPDEGWPPIRIRFSEHYLISIFILLSPNTEVF